MQQQPQHWKTVLDSQEWSVPLTCANQAQNSGHHQQCWIELASNASHWEVIVSVTLASQLFVSFWPTPTTNSSFRHQARGLWCFFQVMSEVDQRQVWPTQLYGFLVKLSSLLQSLACCMHLSSLDTRNRVSESESESY